MILRHKQPSEYSEGAALPTAKLSKRERSNVFSCVTVVFGVVVVAISTTHIFYAACVASVTTHTATVAALTNSFLVRLVQKHE